jgi:hypothetical protein
MPSQLHESHVFLFRNQPSLAGEIMRRALGVEVPAYQEARVISADLTELQPAEYRADLVVQLMNDTPVLGIIVEVQLSTDERKRFVWPAYVANLRARLECPVCLLVVAADDAVARWAAQPVELGGLHWFAPYVLGPSAVPQVTDEAEARLNPELAVLSAMAHGKDVDVERAAQVANAAQAATAGLDADRSKLYFDLIMNSLSEAARQALKVMDLQNYEYQSDFARHYVAQGIAQGEAQGEVRGRASLILRLLSVRFGSLDEAVRARIAASSVVELETIGERLLTARSLRDVLEPA